MMPSTCVGSNGDIVPNENTVSVRMGQSEATQLETLCLFCEYSFRVGVGVRVRVWLGLGLGLEFELRLGLRLGLELE
jgi:hypothetical protein